MAIKNVFKNRLRNTVYLFKDGTPAQFIEGRYETDIASQIRELENDIKSGHPYIYVDEDDSQVDTTMQDAIREAQAEATSRVLKEYQDRTDNGGTGKVQEVVIRGNNSNTASLTPTNTVDSIDKMQLNTLANKQVAPDLPAKTVVVEQADKQVDPVQAPRYQLNPASSVSSGNTAGSNSK